MRAGSAASRVTIALVAAAAVGTMAATVPVAAWSSASATPDPASQAAGELDEAAARRFVDLALACVHREYPNKIAHVLQGDEDVAPPRELTPAFYGCYDWHSAVHGHWLLARLARIFPEAGFSGRAREALGRSLTADNVAAEVRYLEGEGRVSFERPYGIAWILQLAAELREWDDPEAGRWADALEPLERAAVARIADWVPKLTDPIRVGEHSQTAFAFGLILDWADSVRGAAEPHDHERRGASLADRMGDGSLGGTAGDVAEMLRARVLELYLGDRDCPIEYEPSGQDFLSPCLAEADLLRRVLEPLQFAVWLGAFLPGLPLDGSAGWLEPAVVNDPTDPKLAHLDGLNLSRAWMLEGIAAGLPEGDPRYGALREAAERHAAAGLASVTGEHYVGGHWLGSFATYLVTRRGSGW